MLCSSLAKQKTKTLTPTRPLAKAFMTSYSSVGRPCLHAAGEHVAHAHASKSNPLISLRPKWHPEPCWQSLAQPRRGSADMSETARPARPLSRGAGTGGLRPATVDDDRKSQTVSSHTLEAVSSGKWPLPAAASPCWPIPQQRQCRENGRASPMAVKLRQCLRAIQATLHPGVCLAESCESLEHNRDP